MPLCAGVEMSVAATKSYIVSLSALVHLVASWTGDQLLLNALRRSQGSWNRRGVWTGARPCRRCSARRVCTSWAAASGSGSRRKSALKLKETCGLHAEAFSAAEVKHGPMALVRLGFPVLMLSQNDESRAGIVELANDFVERGAEVLVAGIEVEHALSLPTVAADPAIEPMLLIQSFYRMANALAFARGFDPDKPPHLNKVTETL